MKSLLSEKKGGVIAAYALVACLVVCGTACSNDKLYQEEKYKNVVYLLSGSENVYTEAYSLNAEDTVRYFSIGCSGSQPNPEAVTVTLEPDNVLLDQYNKSNFDIDARAYAKVLPAYRYDISSYTVTIPAQSEDRYVKVPVRVRPLGLSPDTIYFIPLAIKSVSRYEVNDDKYNMLFRVTIENDYARQKVVTNYTKKGAVKDQSTNTETSLTGSKQVQPLTKDKVRMFAGNEAQSQTTTPADIARYAITVQVKADSTLNISSYGTMEVEQLPLADYNRYVIEKQGTKELRVFYLYYRYRVLDDNRVTFGPWMENRETLTRVEED
jgi:hypothetical protein